MLLSVDGMVTGSIPSTTTAPRSTGLSLPPTAGCLRSAPFEGRSVMQIKPEAKVSAGYRGLTMGLRGERYRE